jgi:hypothetical protein
MIKYKLSFIFIFVNDMVFEGLLVFKNDIQW